MNLKVLLTTFGMIFLAEMGDKTQLAAITLAAQTRQPLAVFLGASLALTAVSLIGVALGSVLSQLHQRRVSAQDRRPCLHRHRRLDALGQNVKLMGQSAIRLMIVAGEASGDKHGAKLLNALRALRPESDWHCFGAGGDEMRAAGVETLVDAREVAIMGALEVARALPKFLRVFRRLRAAAKTHKPDLVILIDWPEFNLRLAKRLKRDGHRVVYYISPQIWAWRSYRIHSIKRDVERMLVILPFEKDYYERHGVEVDYVGHPLLDSVRVTLHAQSFAHNINSTQTSPSLPCCLAAGIRN
jgi:hypothetical protein